MSFSRLDKILFTVMRQPSLPLIGNINCPMGAHLGKTRRSTEAA
jgi:hypothetical protein